MPLDWPCMSQISMETKPRLPLWFLAEAPSKPHALKGGASEGDWHKGEVSWLALRRQSPAQRDRLRHGERGWLGVLPPQLFLLCFLAATEWAAVLLNALPPCVSALELVTHGPNHWNCEPNILLPFSIVDDRYCVPSTGKWLIQCKILHKPLCGDCTRFWFPCGVCWEKINSSPRLPSESICPGLWHIFTPHCRPVDPRRKCRKHLPLQCPSTALLWESLPSINIKEKCMKEYCWLTQSI